MDILEWIINDSGLESEFENTFDDNVIGGNNKENYFLDPESYN